MLPLAWSTTFAGSVGGIPDVASSCSFAKKKNVFESWLNGSLPLSHSHANTHTHTRMDKCNFSIMIMPIARRGSKQYVGGGGGGEGGDPMVPPCTSSQ